MRALLGAASSSCYVTIGFAVAARIVTAHTRVSFDAAVFTSIGPADLGAMVSWTAGLPISHPTELVDALDARATPGSAVYSEWLPPPTVRELIQPDGIVRAQVSSYLRDHGAHCADLPTGLRCSSTVAAAAALFNTTINEFTVSGGGTLRRVPPDGNFSLPAALVGRLVFVSGMYDFPPRRLRHRVAAGAGLGYAVTPESLGALYGVANGSDASTTSPVSFAPGVVMAPRDAATFAVQMGVPSWTIQRTAGPYVASDIDVEPTLDGQYIATTGAATARSVLNAQWWWAEGDWVFEWTQHVLSTSAPLPSVFSISYGLPESDQCYVFSGGQCGGSAPSSRAYVEQCNLAFAAIGLMGVTVVVASGDAGAAGRTSEDNACSASTLPKPDWPASSPFVLSVGATQMDTGVAPLRAPSSPYCRNTACVGSGREVACSRGTGAQITSGGGFSNVAPQPEWQSAAVARYLRSGALLPPRASFDAGGRGYPDVAAVGHNVVVWFGGQPVSVDGTSASAPMWAAIVGLANAARLAAGLPTVGFVNSALYALADTAPATFRDVIVGNNACNERDCGCAGYGAAPGWDAVTGLGTPNVSLIVAGLLAAAVAPPSARPSPVASAQALSAVASRTPAPVAHCAASACMGCSRGCSRDSTCNVCDAGFALQFFHAISVVYVACIGQGLCINAANPNRQSLAYLSCWAVDAGGACTLCPPGSRCADVAPAPVPPPSGGPPTLSPPLVAFVGAVAATAVLVLCGVAAYFYRRWRAGTSRLVGVVPPVTPPPGDTERIAYAQPARVPSLGGIARALAPRSLSTSECGGEELGGSDGHLPDGLGAPPIVVPLPVSAPTPSTVSAAPRVAFLPTAVEATEAGARVTARLPDELGAPPTVAQSPVSAPHFVFVPTADPAIESAARAAARAHEFARFARWRDDFVRGNWQG